MTKIDIRSKPASALPTATAAQPPSDVPVITRPGIQGQLPLPDVALINPAHLTAAERAIWEKNGWRPGDPIPVPTKDLTPSQQQAVAATSKEARSGFLPPASLQNTPPLQVPDAVDISTLSPERQNELAAALALAKQQQAAIEAGAATQLPNVHPSINQAIGGSPTIVNDLAERATASRVAAQAAEKPPTAASAETTAETTAEEAHKCPHCGWPQNITDPVEVTDQDKRDFIISLWGKPFQRTYSVVGDRMRVTLRNLSPAEVDLCHRQAYLEIMRDELSYTDHRERVMRLRVALQIVALDNASGNLINLPESIDDWVVDDDPKNTKALAVLNYVYTNVLKSESLHRIVAHLCGKFNSLCARLEAHAEDENFYGGIV